MTSNEKLRQLKKAAEQGYRESQEDLEWEYGDRILFYNPKSSYMDDYLNYIPVDISVDDFYYDNRIQIEEDKISAGIVIPKVDTSIHPGSRMEMIDTTHGDRYELYIEPEWSTHQRDTRVRQFIRGAYDRYIRDATPNLRQEGRYASIHQAVVDGINYGRMDIDGDYKYNIYDFAAKDTGGKMQYTWRLRVGVDTHNMCVEHDKKTHETRIIAEYYKLDGDLERKFNVDKYNIYPYTQTPRSEQEVDRLRNNLSNMIQDIVTENAVKQKETDNELIEDLEQDELGL